MDPWIEGSCVVEDDGRPLVVYHGTAQQFSHFDQSTIGTGFKNDKEGFFFTADSFDAGVYASFWTDEGANIIPVHLRITNPLYIDEDLAWEMGLNEDYDDGTLYDNNREAILQRAKEGGHDGIVLDHDAYHFIVFHPNQIRSAIDGKVMCAKEDLDNSIEITDRDRFYATDPKGIRLKEALNCLDGKNSLSKIRP